MRNDEFDRLCGVRGKISFEKLQLAGGEVIAAAVVENGKVSLPVIEAIVRRMAGILSEQLFRERRPDVVVSGGEIDGIPAERLQNPLRFLPLLLCTSVVRPLDCIAHTEHKRWILGGSFVQDLLVNAGDGFSRTVSENHESEGIRSRRGNQRQNHCASGREKHYTGPFRNRSKNHDDIVT